MTYWVGVEDAAQIWGKGVVFGRILLFFLIAAVLLYILSWIVRVLAAIGRNVKKIFTKKQDTASILKELVGGMKQAKEKATPKPVAVEVEPEPTQKSNGHGINTVVNIPNQQPETKEQQTEPKTENKEKEPEKDHEK